MQRFRRLVYERVRQSQADGGDCTGAGVVNLEGSVTELLRNKTMYVEVGRHLEPKPRDRCPQPQYSPVQWRRTNYVNVHLFVPCIKRASLYQHPSRSLPDEEEVCCSIVATAYRPSRSPKVSGLLKRPPLRASYALFRFRWQPTLPLYLEKTRGLYFL